MNAEELAAWRDLVRACCDPEKAVVAVTKKRRRAILAVHAAFRGGPLDGSLVVENPQCVDRRKVRTP